MPPSPLQCQCVCAVRLDISYPLNTQQSTTITLDLDSSPRPPYLIYCFFLPARPKSALNGRPRTPTCLNPPRFACNPLELKSHGSVFICWCVVMVRLATATGLAPNHRYRLSSDSCTLALGPQQVDRLPDRTFGLETLEHSELELDAHGGAVTAEVVEVEGRSSWLSLLRYDPASLRMCLSERRGFECI